MTGRLIVIRHAESTSNVSRMIDSRPPGAPLTRAGEAQAKHLALVLGDRNIGRILTSTALRARQTARPLADHRGLIVETTHELCELDCGDLEGRADADAHARLRTVALAWETGEGDRPVPGGESWNQLRVRLDAVLSDLPPSPWPHDIVLITHSTPVRAIVDILLGNDGANSVTGYPVNAGRVELVPTADGGWTVAHFDPGGADPEATFASVPSPPASAVR